MNSVQELFKSSQKWGHTTTELYFLVNKTKGNIHKELKGLLKRNLVGRVEIYTTGFCRPIIIYTKVRK